jgi:hypothetical protein
MEDERRHFACELRISIAYSERAIDRREDLLGKMRSLEARRFFLYQKQRSAEVVIQSRAKVPSGLRLLSSR